MLMEKTEGEKIITLRSLRSNENTVKIEVIDNGSGILQEDLTKIFSYGFTTKKEGHGFGLHSSSLSAHELGGTLKAYSEGLGKGAKFVLTIPLSTVVAINAGVTHAT